MNYSSKFYIHIIGYVMFFEKTNSNIKHDKIVKYLFTTTNSVSQFLWLCFCSSNHN